MFEFPKLVEIGSQVKVDIACLEAGRFDNDITDELKNNPFGKVVDYKMTDGNKIGFILELNDGTKYWFFSHELEEPFQKGFIKTLSSIDNEDNLNLINHEESSIIDYINSNISPPQRDVKKISSLINPFNFLTWLIYSMKDIL